ncbi:hypothetical protein HELRODRAFT_107370 [Helobdella robusta]|uniref:ceramide glucosyltransferase n=1 Tax=Helobdella robusta TaxID=6412 RepID=T1EEA1_HELRO|nr:hypothetical protein HELRODRAFT_107370 [Helobdella robusta]ESN96218.1 hypothetical protein HELRODRAFT_107370 [Helobdella robusta]
MTLDCISLIIAIIIFGGWWLQWIIHVTAIIYGRIKLHRKLSAPPDFQFPGVSILKPLTGVDPNLYANLETFFHLLYPKYEILFCIEEETDPAVMIVKSLLNKYPNVECSLFVGGALKTTVNPKINNLMQGYIMAKHELILISDSGLKMKEDTLQEMVINLKENVGLVHQLPFVSDRSGFAAVLEKVYFGTQHSKIYLLANMVGVNCVTGMSCLFRKSVVEQSGGFESLGIYLAEDYYLSQICFYNCSCNSGWKVKVSTQPALQNSGTYSIGTFQNRMIRWIKLRSFLVPMTIIMEPLSEWLLLGLISSWAVCRLFMWSPIAFFLVHTLIWFLLDYTLLLTIQGCNLPFSRIDFVAGWLFRECTSLLLMLRAHTVRTLTWRSRQYIIGRHTIGEEIRKVHDWTAV